MALLFQPARNTSAHLKMGLMGKQGAGKSKTAGKVAIGLVQHCKGLGLAYADKPVAFFDTETGSDYLIPDFEAAGIPLVQAKTKTLADLVEAIDWAEQNASVMIIDSITHPYREMIAAYLKKKNRTFLQMDDWQYLKGEYGWVQFTKRFVNSKLHIIMCGRAGDDLEQYTDENGKRQLEKVGTKMSTEKETGFEPSLLVLMELIERSNREAGARKRIFVNRAIVVKDRWDKINGDEIDYPEFKDFMPHIELLALGGEHVGVRDTGDSQRILKTEKRDWQPVQRDIVLDEIQTLLVLHVPGQAANDKQRKAQLVRQHFAASWTEMEKVMPLEQLRAGYDTLHRELEGQPSRYATTQVVDDGKPIDSLPDHSAATTAPATAAEPDQVVKLDESEKPLEQKLRAQLAELTTAKDVMHWGLEASKHDGVDIRMRMRLADAMSLRLGEIAKANNAAAKAQAEPESEKTEPKPAKPARGRGKAVTEPETEREPVVAQTYIDEGLRPVFFG